jgi:hypothetical protein
LNRTDLIAKISQWLWLTVLFVVLFFVVYLIHSWYFKVNVVFYAALIDAIIAVSITSIFIFFGSFSHKILVTEKLLLLLIWALLGYSIAISVPTVVDRSLSFYILEKLEQRGGSIRQSAFEDIFRREYMIEHRLMDVRLTEQLESGTITISEQCVRLTETGRLIAKSSSWIRQHLLPKQRQILGEYSDALTNPIQNSSLDKEPDYHCE